MTLRPTVLVAAMTLVAGSLWAQSPQSKSRQPGPSSAVGRVEVTFAKDDKVPQVAASPLMVLPLRCSSDGTAFLEMAELTGPPQYYQSRVMSISTGGVQGFNLAAASDLYEVSLVSYSPGDSMVVFLVNATRDNRESKRTIQFANGEKKEEKGKFGEKQDFLVLFDRKGEYKKTVELDLPFKSQRIGMFPSGQLLVIGYDTVRKSAQFALLKDDGSLLRLLDIPHDISFDKGNPGKLNQAMVGVPGAIATTNLSTAQLIPYKDSLLIVIPRSFDFVIEVTSGGEIRRLPILIPEGYALDYLLPSSSGLYARLRKPTGDESSPMTPAVLYELSPHDGSLLREIVPVGLESDSLACEYHGELLGFSRAENGNLIAMRGKF